MWKEPQESVSISPNPIIAHHWRSGGEAVGLLERLKMEDR